MRQKGQWGWEKSAVTPMGTWALKSEGSVGRGPAVPQQCPSISHTSDSCVLHVTLWDLKNKVPAIKVKILKSNLIFFQSVRSPPSSQVLDINYPPCLEFLRAANGSVLYCCGKSSKISKGKRMLWWHKFGIY